MYFLHWGKNSHRRWLTWLLADAYKYLLSKKMRTTYKLVTFNDSASSSYAFGWCLPRCLIKCTRVAWGISMKMRAPFVLLLTCYELWTRLLYKQQNPPASLDCLARMQALHTFGWCQWTCLPCKLEWGQWAQFWGSVSSKSHQNPCVE